ncbi:unnamed protein product [Mytilus coruscus]|uniref:Transposase Helix-turn-helix domain-containing protein n=1 Tax=Mytilus coruscus TaxID=42192 RepID=A0A6J8EP82_MYTCO|nr:unnamed protein product [Mytilus coruscus]
MFDTIHEEIEPKLIFEHRGGNEQITPRKQLLLFLCYMANNETFRELGQYFGVGKSTAHVCIARVLEAFCEIFLDIIQWPSLQRQDELSREIQLLHMLPNIIGAIDGTHIRLSSCPSNDNDYYNRKGFPSMQLQAVERTIGHVKGRFRRLRELIIHEPKQIVLTILAGCILHNLCIIAHEDIDLYIDRDNDNHPKNYVNIFQNDVGGVEIRQQMMENLP